MPYCLEQDHINIKEMVDMHRFKTTKTVQNFVQHICRGA